MRTPNKYLEMHNNRSVCFTVVQSSASFPTRNRNCYVCFSGSVVPTRSVVVFLFVWKQAWDLWVTLIRFRSDQYLNAIQTSLWSSFLPIHTLSQSSSSPCWKCCLSKFDSPLNGSSQNQRSLKKRAVVMLARVLSRTRALRLHFTSRRFKQTGCQSDEHVRRFILDNTEVVGQRSLTPELKLRLLTANCRFWRERPELWPFHDPYWAIYWPGGQALSRYRCGPIGNCWWWLLMFCVCLLSINSVWQISVGQPCTVSGENGPGSGQRLWSLGHCSKSLWCNLCGCQRYRHW